VTSRFRRGLARLEMRERERDLDATYPDTADGVRAMLRDVSTFDVDDDAPCSPDPCVDGVWLVDLSPSADGRCDAVIAYLAGYAGRRFNDFEAGTRRR